MRIVLALALMVGCTEQAGKPTPDAGMQVDPLATRLALCGSAASEPVLDPATLTDSHGYQYIALSVDHWNADAAYMDASKAWADCIVYGAH